MPHFTTTTSVLAAILFAIPVLAASGCGDDTQEPGQSSQGGSGAVPSEGGSALEGGSASEGGSPSEGGSGGEAPCSPGEQEPCYTGRPATQDVGICTSGLRTCNDDGTFSDCEGEVLPGTESCDSPQDEDCDGEANEEGASCICVPGSTEPCYTGPVETQDVGLCVTGSRTCSPTGLAYGTCFGEVLPVSETCTVNGDEDCDGLTNEEGPDCVCVPGTTQACYSASPATLGVGACQGGTQTCNPSGQGYGACVGEVTPLAETCNTPVDDDCDGDTNEGGVGCVCPPGELSPCYTGPAGTVGIGACIPGTALCNDQGTALGTCTGDVLPTTETCTTLVDDDCDGEINEEGAACVCVPGATDDCYTGLAGTLGVGLCTAGERTCSWHGLGYGACTGDVVPTTETCASAGDENCNGDELICTGDHVWSRRFGTATLQIGNDVAVDAQGNVLVTGYFAGAIDLGGGVLTSAGGDDIFVAKLDAAGNHIWSRRFGAGGTDAGTAVGTDPSGDVFVGGKAAATVDFGGGAIASGAVFVLKLDVNGNHVWSRRFGASAGDVHDLVVEPAGDVVVVGRYTNSINFGGTALNSAGADDIFMAKLGAAAGAHVWSRRFGSTESDIGHGVVLDTLGNIVMTGSFRGFVGFGGGGHTSAGSDDIFVAKFNSAGTGIWSHRFGSITANQRGRVVATDSLNAVVVAGDLTGTINFGAGPHTVVGNVDMFLLKLDHEGATQWSRHFGAVNEDRASGLDIDGEDNISIGGQLRGTIDFGGGPLVSTSGSTDVFVAKFDAAGSHAWSKRFGDAFTQVINGLTVDADDDILIVGDVDETIDFGGGPLTSAGNFDVFVAKLAP